MEITLQELLDELARDGGDLAALLRRHTDEGSLTTEQIAALRDEATSLFRTIHNGDSLTEADVASLESFAEAIQALNAEDTHLSEVAAATQERVAEIAARAGLAEDTPSESAEDAPVEDEDAAPVEADTPTDEAPADAPPIEADVETGGGSETPAPEAVAAAATPPVRRRRVDVAAIARRAPRVDPATMQVPGSDLPFGGSLVASADAPGMRGGAAYGSWLDLGSAAAQRFGSATPSQLMGLVASAERAGADFYQRNGLAEFRMHFDPELVIDDPNADSTAILARAADQARLPGGSLIAAGGWCSPSETMYDLCDLPCSLDGILSLPEVSAPRGGIRWTKGLNFEDIYTAPGFFHFTEAQMMAEPRPDKPCMEIPCVEFEECRLDVDGLCITADIMQSRTYPEIIAQFIQGAMCAHAHRVNAFKINAIVAGSTDDGTITQAGYGATNSVLYAIELEIQAYRYRGRRAQEGNPALLELVAPYWMKAVLRADIANRNAPSGIGNPMAVSDAEIVQWFATRGVAVRFVYDWQDLVGVVEEPGAPVTDYPNTVQFILYEAGTWVVPSLDVITLETLYDSTLIKQNKYQALFTEQAFCVVNRCNESRLFTVPICANGNTGAQVAVTCA